LAVKETRCARSGLGPGRQRLRGRATGNFDLTRDQKSQFAANQVAFESYLKERGTRDVDVLMVYDPDFPIRGRSGAAYAGVDEQLRPAIHFTMRSLGAPKMGYVTQGNLHRKLAIIFDNTLLSAPVIQSQINDNGQITGNFAQEEVDFIVGILKSGSMPVVMQKKPTSENQIGSILGRDTIVKGSYSVLISLGLILVFMVLYYRFAGLVASFALALNLLLTVAIMVLLKASFTLPGLAGLVLTVAMSVDANVLISERMREELERGATLRMAIRNGFDKALSAIIDGNLTTFLTALVLYFIGTDQVKGFGCAHARQRHGHVHGDLLCPRDL
jgi:SecD/SecF fusion protein